jgi:competence ComEA-like helix-hairpin-helix protein
MIHLTLQEKKVLLFLSFVFLVGLGVTVFKKSSGCNSCLIDIYTDKKTPGPLDINKATFEQLVGLPGIGEKTAENIILFRSKNGAFRSVDDLKSVSGVTGARLAQCKDLIAVR